MIQAVKLHGAQKYAIDEESFIIDDKKHYDLKKQFLQTFGCGRKVYNLFLDYFYNTLEKLNYVNGTLPSISLPEVSTFKKEFSYLKDVDALALANAKIHAQSAISKFKNGRSQSEYRKGAVLRAEKQPDKPLTPRDLKGMPVFKSKKRGDFSYTTNNQLASESNGLKQDTIRLAGNRLHLPKIKKDVILVLHRDLPENAVIKNVTISMDPQGKFYASIGFEYEILMDLDIRTAVINGDASILDKLSFIGLDYDQNCLYVDSNGNESDYPYYYRQAQEKLAELQRKLSRKVEGSKNYERLCREIAALHAHIANQRRDFLHKLSTKLVREYDVVCVEDIDLRAMGSALSLGKNLHDGGFGMFRVMLAYKLQRKGSCLVKIDRWFPSSKKCSCCGYVNADLKLGDEYWECPNCHTKHHRDENASVNIREEGNRIFMEYFQDLMAKEDEANARALNLHNARKNKSAKKTSAPKKS